MADTFLSDTEAPSLGLYLVRVPSGIAYEVKRPDDGVYHSVNTGVDETLFCGSRAQVKLFLRGCARPPGNQCPERCHRRRGRGHRPGARRGNRGREHRAGRPVVIRLDRYAPEWAIGIVEDLEAGESGREAVARAAENLRNQAIEAEARAADYAGRAAKAMIGTFICAEDLTREHREHESEARRYADYLRTTAGNVAKLKGEYIAIARMLR